MTLRPLTAGLLGLAVGLGVALALELRPRGAGEKVPAELAKTADSLATTRPAAESRRDSTLRLVVVDTVRAVRAERLARARRDSAEGFRKRADSVAALAEAYGDSAFLWKVAYDNRTEEADQLRAANVAADSALQAERSARIRIDDLWRDTEARRRVAEERVIPGLERAIGLLEKPCHVGPVRCPSRRVSFVVGAVGAVVVLSATK